MKILTWIVNRVERWFNRIVHQAIIDGVDLYRRRSLHGLPAKPKRRPNLINLAYVAVFVLNVALILAMVYVAITYAQGG